MRSFRSFGQRWAGLAVLLQLLLAGAAFNPGRREPPPPTPHTQTIGVSAINCVTTGPGTSNTVWTTATADLPAGDWLISVIPVGADICSAPHGRYFLVSQLLNVKNAANPIQNVWSGYTYQGAVASFPNMRIRQGMQVTSIVWGGTNGSTGQVNQNGVIAWVSDEPILGGTWIYAEPPGSGDGEIIGNHPTFAVGTDVTITVPSLVRWRWRGFRGELTTDATAGTRSPHPLWIDQNGHQTIDWNSGDTTTVGPSSIIWLSISDSGISRGQSGGAASSSTLLIPLMKWSAGSAFETNTQNFDPSGDAWTNVSFLAEEWVYPNP